VTSRRHESVNLADPHARRLLTLLDGTRDHRALLRDLGSDYDRGAEGVEAMLNAFARLSLLVH
jgi:hypothetical protein